MQNRIEVKEAVVENNELVLTAKVDKMNSSLSATGRMLVDSDGFSFIYILENEEAFVYVSLPENIWSEIKKVSEDMKVLLHMNGNTIELTDFHEELQYLITNIEGNSNYGKDMVQKVEEVFLDKLN